MNPWTIIARSVEDGNGGISAMRVIVLYGSFTSLTVPAILWLAAMHWPGVQSLCVPASGAFGGTLTALLGLKLVQNSQENSAVSKQPTP